MKKLQIKQRSKKHYWHLLLSFAQSGFFYVPSKSETDNFQYCKIEHELLPVEEPFIDQNNKEYSEHWG